MGDNLPFVDLGTGRTAISLSAGEAHVCALLDDASVKVGFFFFFEMSRHVLDPDFFSGCFRGEFG